MTGTPCAAASRATAAVSSSLAASCSPACEATGAPPACDVTTGVTSQPYTGSPLTSHGGGTPRKGSALWPVPPTKTAGWLGRQTVGPGGLGGTAPQRSSVTPGATALAIARSD